MRWRNSWYDRLEPQVEKEREANDAAERRVEELERQHTLETLGAGRVSRHWVTVVAGVLILALVIFNVLARL